ncbi:MAG: hypothetical protein R2839_02765 [Thermomicrobiales bacterium]
MGIDERLGGGRHATDDRVVTIFSVGLNAVMADDVAVVINDGELDRGATEIDTEQMCSVPH